MRCEKRRGFTIAFRIMQAHFANENANRVRRSGPEAGGGQLADALHAGRRVQPSRDQHATDGLIADVKRLVLPVGSQDFAILVHCIGLLTGRTALQAAGARMAGSRNRWIPSVAACAAGSGTRSRSTKRSTTWPSSRTWRSPARRPTPRICSCATIKSAITTSSPSGATSASTSRSSGTNTARALSFAPENDLMQVLGLIPGAVTPLGLLNDAECKVQLYLDEAFSPHRGSSACTRTITRPPCGCARTISRL